MHALIVLAHPEPKSFNAQLKDVAADALLARDHSVEVSDLYAEGFDPLEGPAHYAAPQDPARFSAQDEQRHAWDAGTTAAEVSAEIDKLERADLVIFQYPIWWFSMPAMLKGWLDRVLVYGLYTSKVRYDTGHFSGRRAMLSVTTGAPEPTFAHNGRNGDIELVLWPMNFTLHYMGFTVLPPVVSYAIESGLAYSDPAEVPARLEGYKAALRQRLTSLDETAPLRFNGWGDWDERGQLKPGVPGHSPFMRAER